MKDIVRYWQFEYDWRKQEQILNEKLPGFKINVDGLDIHFAHVKVGVVLLRVFILINIIVKRTKRCYSALNFARLAWFVLRVQQGCRSPDQYVSSLPGYLFSYIIDPSAHGITGGNSFHVVCPSLPGYGFSDKPRKKG
jgi:hypothetical protein